MFRQILLLMLIFLFELNGTAQIEPAFQEFNSFQKVRDLNISSNLKEAFFTVQSPLEEISVIVQSNFENGQWTTPTPLPFSNGKFKDLEPFLSPDGLTLYFASNRPLLDTDEKAKDFDIWYTTRTSLSTKWENPQNLGTPINTSDNEFYPAISSNGNLYFTSDNPKGKGKDDIFCSILQDGTYQTPFSLNKGVNTEGYEFNAFVASDESYLLFSGYKRPDGLGSGDLYISFKQKDKSWSKAINLGEQVNSPFMDFCPFVDAKGTLYFTSRRSNYDSSVSIQSTDQLIKLLEKHENGLSRHYQFPFSTLLKRLNK